MKFKFKDKPLSFQIWIILGLILGGTAVLLTLVIPIILRISFTRESFARLEDAQEYLLDYGNESEDFFYNFPDYQSDRGLNTPPLRIVRHSLITKEGLVIGGKIPLELGRFFVNDALKQDEIKNSYQKSINDRLVFYLIRQININETPYYLVSYISSAYRDNLVKLIFRQLLKVLLIILIVSWIASLFLAKYLTRPLKKLEKWVINIANKKWDVPVDLNRNDEIGRLGKAMDSMRNHLVIRDEKQQEFLQEASHELKTPIMVIRSYVQSLLDGIIPNKDINKTLQRIEDETFKMEKRVHSLLNITKMDHLANQSLKKEKVKLDSLILKKVNRFEWRNIDIDWNLELKEISYLCDKEKMEVVLDNIFDNQLKYAENTVAINLYKDDEFIMIKIKNDGPYIEEENLEKIFKKYQKGEDGEFGLGLAIAEFIIKLHDGEIWAVNEDNGPAFYIKMPPQN